MKRLEEKGGRGIMKIEERRGWKRKTNGVCKRQIQLEGNKILIIFSDAGYG